MNKRAIFDVGHPAHVHLVKNTISNLIRAGWNVKVMARPREITVELLNKYGLDYHRLGHYEGIFGKVIGMFLIDLRFWRIARDFNPDILVSVGSPYAAQISWILRKPHIAFTDTPAKKNTLYYFASYGMLKAFKTIICTPDIFPMDSGQKKQIRYKGYHEIAYLHPKYFSPDVSVLGQMGLSPKDKFILVRFAAWDALHDIGQRGFTSTKERVDFVRELEKYCRVFVTSEIMIPELKNNIVPTSPEKIHSLLAFATMYVGEGATMASEAGVLGVPWVFIYSRRLPYLDDQEKEYGLGMTLDDTAVALQFCLKLLQRGNLKQEWSKKREKLLKDKIDVTNFMTNLIMEYSKDRRKLQLDFIPQ